MNRSKAPLIITLAILVIVAVAVTFIVSGKKKDNGTTSTNSSSSTSNSSSPSSSAVATDQVSIQNFAFSPTTINIKAGTKVSWTNQDSTSHTVTADDGSFSSSTLGQGQIYSFTFTKAGTYTYHCTIHPSMHGTVVVSQ
jgi:plastocyanin